MDTPDSSPLGPMHMVAPTVRPYSRATSIAHSISRILRKYSQMISSILFLTRISRADLSSTWILLLSALEPPKIPVCVMPPATMVPLDLDTFFAMSQAAWLISSQENLHPFGKESS